MDQDTFLLQDYQLKISYLTNHFTRMWTRFNFFLTINSALFGFSFNSSYKDNEIYLIWAGITFSGLWFYFGAVDNYLATLYRSHVEYSFHLLTGNLTTETPSSASEVEPPELTTPAMSPAPHATLAAEFVARSCFVGDTGKRNYYGWDRKHQQLGDRKVRGNLLAFRGRLLSATELAAFFPFVFLIAWMFRLIIEGSFDWRAVLDRLC